MEKVKIRITIKIRHVVINKFIFWFNLAIILFLTIIIKIKIQIVKRIRLDDKESINNKLLDKGAKKIELDSLSKKINPIVIKIITLVCFIKFEGVVSISVEIIRVFNILGYLRLLKKHGRNVGINLLKLPELL